MWRETLRCYSPRLQDMCVSVGEGCGVGCEEVMAVAPLVVMMVAREGEGWSVRVRRSVRRVLPLESGEQRDVVELRFVWGDGDGDDHDDNDHDDNDHDQNGESNRSTNDDHHTHDGDDHYDGHAIHPNGHNGLSNEYHATHPNLDDDDDDDDDDNAWCKETKNLPPTTKRLHLYPSLHTRSADGWHRFYWILYPSLHDYHVTTFHSFSLHRSRHAPHSLQLQWFYVNLLETHAQMLQCDCTRNPRLFRRFAAQRARRRASRTFREQQAAGVTVRPRRAALGLREKGPYSAGGDSAGGGFLADFRQWEVGGSDADHEFLFEEA